MYNYQYEIKGMRVTKDPHNYKEGERQPPRESDNPMYGQTSTAPPIQPITNTSRGKSEEDKLIKMMDGDSIDELTPAQEQELIDEARANMEAREGGVCICRGSAHGYHLDQVLRKNQGEEE